MTDTKGDRTRERIVSTAAPLFNQRGYAGASVADLMSAAGLEKGGIYRHFQSKDQIAVEAFEHTARLQGERLRAHVAAAPSGAVARIIAFAEGLGSVAVTPAVAGGCPLLNTAVESDDGESELHRELRARARRAMTKLIDAARRIIADGIESGELKQSTNVAAEASNLVAIIEGGVMLSKLYKDPTHLRHAIDSVRIRAESLAARKSGRGKRGTNK